MGQIGRCFDCFIGELHDDVSRLQASPISGRIFANLGDQCASWPIQTEGVSQVPVDILNTDAQPTPLDATGILYLGHHIPHYRHRDRER